MNAYFDERETRPPEEREARLLAALPGQVARARKTPGQSGALSGIEPEDVSSREALAQLPVIRKGDLIERQTGTPPFGGLNHLPTERMTRLFLSPGPIADPQGRRPDYWRMARALHAAGFRAGDIVLNCFSYHFTPAGMMFDGAAAAIGCPVIPGGTGQTDSQIQAIGYYRPNGYAGTPDFLKIILDKADETGADVSSIRRGAVGGGALLPPLRKEYDDRGIAVLQSYGTADVGLIAYESEAREGMILDEDVIVEILRPGTGTPLPDGEVGEVAVTLLDEDYPLLRFATGDLSAILPGQSPCGRTAPRIRGWLGRADQRTKIRGMFVDPAQIDRVLRAHPPVRRMRLVVGDKDGIDAPLLRCETDGGSQDLADAVAESFRAECKLRTAVELVEAGALPNDGKVIDDRRDYG